MQCPICQTEFNEHTGRRPKRFCGVACKIKFFNLKKKADRLIKDLGTEATNRDNALINAARGRNATGVNNDEGKTEKTKKKLELPTMPVKQPGEDPFDFAARKNEWKKKYGI